MWKECAVEMYESVDVVEEDFLVSFFFFSSRRRHTRCSRDWSSDVCSSDLLDSFPGGQIWVEHGILRRGCHCRARRDRLAFGQPRTYPGPFVEKFIDLTGFI